MHFASKRNHQKEKNKLRVSFEGKKKDETRGRGGKIKRTRDGKRRERKWTDLRQQWIKCVHFWIFKNYIYIYIFAFKNASIEQPDLQGQKSEIGNGRVICSRASNIDLQPANDKTLEDSFVPRDPECVIAPLSANAHWKGWKVMKAWLRGQPWRLSNFTSDGWKFEGWWNTWRLEWNFNRYSLLFGRGFSYIFLLSSSRLSSR